MPNQLCDARTLGKLLGYSAAHVARLRKAGAIKAFRTQWTDENGKRHRGRYRYDAASEIAKLKMKPVAHEPSYEELCKLDEELATKRKQMDFG